MNSNFAAFLKKTGLAALCFMLIITGCMSVFAATEKKNTGNAPLEEWHLEKANIRVNTSTQSLIYTNTAGKKINIGKYSIPTFNVSKNYLLYYGINAKGKLKWVTYNLKSGAKKEYAYDFISPFWSNDLYVYSSSSGKRVYDYIIHRFNLETGKSTKIADVYGMPIGYSNDLLVALDFNHKEVRYYSGSQLKKSVKVPEIKNGVIAGGTIYVMDGTQLFWIKDGKLQALAKTNLLTFEGINQTVLAYRDYEGYPFNVYLLGEKKCVKLGKATDDKSLAIIKAQAINYKFD